MKQVLITSLCGLLSMMALAPIAQSAERLKLRYGPLERSLPVSDLSTLVETGTPSPELSQYLRFAKKSPNQLREGLSFSVPASPRTLDRLLYSPMGEALLSEMSHYVHTSVHGSQGQANTEALRSAFLLSASDDQEISLIEVLQHYPTPDITVEGDKVLKAYRNVNRWVVRGQAVLPVAQDLAQRVQGWLKQSGLRSDRYQ